MGGLRGAVAEYPARLPVVAREEGVELDGGLLWDGGGGGGCRGGSDVELVEEVGIVEEWAGGVWDEGCGREVVFLDFNHRVAVRSDVEDGLVSRTDEQMLGAFLKQVCTVLLMLFPA